MLQSSNRKTLPENCGHTHEGEDHSDYLEPAQPITGNKYMGEEGCEEWIDRNEDGGPAGKCEVGARVQGVNLDDEQSYQKQECAAFPRLESNGNFAHHCPGEHGKATKEEPGSSKGDGRHTGKTYLDGHGIAAPQDGGQQSKTSRFKCQSFVQYIQLSVPDSLGKRRRPTKSEDTSGSVSQRG